MTLPFNDSTDMQTNQTSGSLVLPNTAESKQDVKRLLEDSPSIKEGTLTDKRQSVQCTQIKHEIPNPCIGRSITEGDAEMMSQNEAGYQSVGARTSPTEETVFHSMKGKRPIRIKENIQHFEPREEESLNRVVTPDQKRKSVIPHYPQTCLSERSEQSSGAVNVPPKKRHKVPGFYGAGNESTGSRQEDYQNKLLPDIWKFIGKTVLDKGGNKFRVCIVPEDEQVYDNDSNRNTEDVHGTGNIDRPPEPEDKGLKLPEGPVDLTSQPLDLSLRRVNTSLPTVEVLEICHAVTQAQTTDLKVEDDKAVAMATDVEENQSVSDGVAMSVCGTEHSTDMDTEDRETGSSAGYEISGETANIPYILGSNDGKEEYVSVQVSEIPCRNYTPAELTNILSYFSYYSQMNKNSVLHQGSSQVISGNIANVGSKGETGPSVLQTLPNLTLLGNTTADPGKMASSFKQVKAEPPVPITIPEFVNQGSRNAALGKKASSSGQVNTNQPAMTSMPNFYDLGVTNDSGEMNLSKFQRSQAILSKKLKKGKTD